MSDVNLLPEPKFLPELHPTFRPAILVNRAFEAAARDTGAAVEVGIALEQADGSMFHYHTVLFPSDHELEPNNFRHLERMVKFLLWQRGGWKIHLNGADAYTERLQEYYRTNEFGKFDDDVIGVKNNGHSLEVVACAELPAENSEARPLGRHLEGNRIGFDLGGSDRKAAAVVDGEVKFSEEIVWDPYFEPNPDYHYEGIIDSLKRAAEHLPSVDAIGGSAAGRTLGRKLGGPLPQQQAPERQGCPEWHRARSQRGSVRRDGRNTELGVLPKQQHNPGAWDATYWLRRRRAWAWLLLVSCRWISSARCCWGPLWLRMW